MILAGPRLSKLSQAHDSLNYALVGEDSSKKKSNLQLSGNWENKYMKDESALENI